MQIIDYLSSWPSGEGVQLFDIFFPISGRSGECIYAIFSFWQTNKQIYFFFCFMDSILNEVLKSNFGYDIIQEIEPERKIFVS